MKILLIFSLYLISAAGGSRRVRGFSGGGVLIKCRYDTKYKSNTKYFCKGSGLICVDQIKTDVKNAWVNSGRFSLFDDTSAAVFWVKIRDLTVEDFGTYQCAVDIKRSLDHYTPVELKVEEVSDCNSSIHVTGRAGGSVNISCKYPDVFRTYPKFLCRREDSDECVYETPVKESGKWINQGKYSLHDNRVKNTLSVIISEVRERDSGEYWCGAESDWESDNEYKIYITHINLTVTDLDRTPPRKSWNAVGGGVDRDKRGHCQITSDVTYRPQTPGTEKVAPATTSSSTSSSSETQPEELNTTSTLTSTGPSLSDASKASTTNPVVFVFVVLLMSGFIFFIVALWKRHTTQAPASAPTQSQTNSSENHRDSDAEADYEDIHEPRQLPATDSGLFTVYTTAKFPTDTVTVYSYVHLPTKTCNPTKPINSNAELPIGLSDSAESPIYATVDLSKKADGFAVSTATINKQRN
ncbi:CMRF35-like molecule 9 isoform X2 [Hoplias malabaricus]|uniref:CMRF35-like molecule 9 isoform X2 n=1 Tax=Hoplias malabaricus TaxID=27720 RepID=UPI003462A5BE